MGQKVSPIGLRVGIIRDWDAKWYAPKDKVLERITFENSRKSFEEFMEEKNTVTPVEANVSAEKNEKTKKVASIYFRKNKKGKPLPLMILCSTVVLHLCPSVAKNMYSFNIINLTLIAKIVKKKNPPKTTLILAFISLKSSLNQLLIKSKCN